jgi:hypothetical protein
MSPDVSPARADGGMDHAFDSIHGERCSLTGELDGYDYSKINDHSLIGRLFRKLWDYAMDANYGPFYAADLLRNGVYDLCDAIDVQIKTAEAYRDRQILQGDAMAIDRVGEHDQKTYANDVDGTSHLHLINYTVSQYSNTVKVLMRFKEQIGSVYTDFFKPLCDMVNNLKQTFEENRLYMNEIAASKASNCTWQVVNLDELRP